MNRMQELTGAVLFVLGVAALLGSWAVSGTLAAVGGLGAVVLMASGTVLFGAEPRSDEPVSGRPE